MLGLKGISALIEFERERDTKADSFLEDVL